ncbi:MAG: hypothetical protein A2428_12970 [Bdellovibrionales bacterium RIFOXYC1_FULL_54_43]|nr:MAG: hypothetical protein A2428_12970 [Bdellovibrionales bacterium RIFOXYC1_FULL_54_43]OFZ83981.1 MAG: hypothetical protein A2603_10550 [Bdellovibrionales bacterium RIFOXYD1_FULL_55_31]
MPCPAKDLTLIIPCYNEESHLRESFAELLSVMKYYARDFEILLIDDCSTDNTRSILKDLVDLDPRVRVILNERNLGRGATVSVGIQQSRAKVVGFIDIDLSTQPVYVPYLADLVLNGKADIATCKRTYKIEFGIIHRVFHRLILSYGYRIFSRLVFRHGLQDTETGFKFFDREKITPVLDEVQDKHWFWDTETMVLSRLSGLSVIEVPSIYIRRPEKPTTVKVFRDVARYLTATVRLKRRLAVRQRLKFQSEAPAALKPAALLFSLRSEQPFTGEYKSTRAVLQLLEEAGFDARVFGQETHPGQFNWRLIAANLMRPFLLRRAAINGQAEVLVLKVPTAAQIPFVQALCLGSRKRIIYWIDGLCWYPIPVSFSVRMFLDNPVLHLGRILLNNRYWPRLIRTSAIHGCVVAAECQTKDLPCRLHSKVKVIPNVAPNVAVSKDLPITRLKNGGGLVIGHLGHTYLNKGLEDLVGVLSELKKDGFSFEARFALSRLGRRGIARKIVQSGFTCCEIVDVRDFFSTIDVLVAPYWTDWGTQVYPKILLESLEFGVPVITSDLPVTRDLFAGEGRLACWISPGNRAELKAVLARFIRGEIELAHSEEIRSRYRSLEESTKDALREFLV